jgi:hypothetical protein
MGCRFEKLRILEQYGRILFSAAIVFMAIGVIAVMAVIQFHRVRAADGGFRPTVVQITVEKAGLAGSRVGKYVRRRHGASLKS